MDFDNCFNPSLPIVTNKPRWFLLVAALDSPQLNGAGEEVAQMEATRRKEEAQSSC